MLGCCVLSLVFLLGNLPRHNKYTIVVCSLLSGVSIYNYLYSPTQVYINANAWNVMTSVNITYCIIVLAIFCFYFRVQKYIKNYFKLDYSIVVPSILLSAWMVLGKSYATVGSWNLIVGFSNGFFVISCIEFVGFYILFSYAFACIYKLFDSTQIGNSSRKISYPNIRVLKWYAERLEGHPFTTALITLTLLWMPYAIVSYPGTLSYDGMMEIFQIYGVWELNTHHPIVHIIMLKYCLALGVDLFNSGTIGMMIYTTLQVGIVILAISMGLHVMIRYFAISVKWSILVLIYFCIHPQLNYSLFYITKDVVYSGFLLLYIISRAIQLRQSKSNKEILTHVFVCLSACMVVFFRNEGYYILLICILFDLLLIKKQRIKTAITLMTATLAYLFVIAIIPKAINATIEKNPDVFGIQIQQIARCVAEGKELSNPESVQALHSIFNVEKLKTAYDYKITDPSKACIWRNLDSSSTKALLSVWFDFLKEHAPTCIQATLHHHYDTLYPSLKYTVEGWAHHADEYFESVNKNCSESGLRIEYPPSLHHWACSLEGIRNQILFNNYIGSIISSAAPYVWVLIALLFYACKKHSILAISLLMPSLITVLVLFSAPCGAYAYRYSLPLYFLLPFLTLTTTKLANYEYEQTNRRSRTLL